MLKRMLVAIGLAASLLPALSASAAAPVPEVFRPSGPVRAVSGYADPRLGSAQVLAGAWRRQQIARLAAAGVPAPVLDAGQRGGRGSVALAQESGAIVVVSYGSSAVLLPSALFVAGDLNGDRRRDLLDVRYATRPDRTGVVGLTARDAQTGRVLWHRTASIGKDHVLFPAPARIGAPARDGIVLYDYGVGDQTTAGLTALDGRTGEPVWRYRAVGTTSGEDDSYSGTRVPSFIGVAESSGATRFLLSVSDFRYDLSQDQVRGSGSVQPYAVDGATGRAGVLGARTSSSTSVPAAYALPDLSGDGQNDLGVLVGGEDGTLQARDSRTGAALWTHSGTPLHGGAYPVPVGRVLAGGTPDLALVTGTPDDPFQEATPLGDLVPRTAPAHGDVVLLSGRDGTAVASVPGDGALLLGRAGDPAVPAFGVFTADATSTANRTEVTLHVAAHDASGAQRWHQQLTYGLDEGDGFAGGFAYELGDLDRDGALELRAELYVLGGEGQFSAKRYLLDGRSGTQLQHPGDALFGSTSRHGDDLVSVAGGKGALVTLRSGRTGTAVWSTRVAAPTPLKEVQAYAGRVRDDPCNDVLVVAGGPDRDVIAVLSNTGRIRWSAAGPARTTAARAATAYRAPVLSCR